MLKQHVHEDITTEQFTFLQFIHEEQTVTASEIAQVFGVGRSAITAVVNRLEQKELIVRKRNETDRRIVHISLTRKGKKVVLATEEEINRFINEQLAHFNVEDIEKFLLALEQLSQSMEDSTT
ncbi:MAG TPA: MarR family transcriptional regulator [Bacillota bacterium]|nr:MarR family transcriptional regulator [Bacillota bacterium]